MATHLHVSRPRLIIARLQLRHLVSAAADLRRVEAVGEGDGRASRVFRPALGCAEIRRVTIVDNERLSRQAADEAVRCSGPRLQDDSRRRRRIRRVSPGMLHARAQHADGEVQRGRARRLDQGSVPADRLHQGGVRPVRAAPPAALAVQRLRLQD